MKRYAAGVLVAAVVVVAVVVRPERAVGVLRTALASPWFPVILVGLYAVRPLLGWPISLLSALVGFRYGFVVGVPVALAGAVGTSLLPYLAGRFAPSDGRIFGRFSDGSQQYFDAAGPMRGLVAARLAPTHPEPVSAAAGAGGVSLRAFAAGTLLGELPWVLGAVAVGSGLDAFTMQATAVDPVYIAAGLLAALVVLSPVAYRAWRRRERRA
jgi:uncharacterized membrane protein YdjX (TVP38/TMEM64 family)